METTLEENMMSALEEIINLTEYHTILEVNGWTLDYCNTTKGPFLAAHYLLDYPTGDEEDVHLFTDLDESIEFIKKQTGLKSIEI